MYEPPFLRVTPQNEMLLLAYAYILIVLGASFQSLLLTIVLSHRLSLSCMVLSIVE